MWVVPLIALALVVLGLSGCHRRVEEAEADAEASTGTNPVGSATQGCTSDDCQQFRERIDSLLEDSATGREALQYLHDHHVPVVVVNDGLGSRYSNRDGCIYLDRADGPHRGALALVHETEHRRRLDSGQRPNIHTSSREDYVYDMIQEETAATTAAVRTRQELIDAGHVGTRGVEYPGAADYPSGVRQEEEAFRQENPGASEAEVEDAGREGGRGAVESGFYDGRYTTTNTSTGEDQTYPDYYGSEWDAAHPNAAGLANQQ